MLLCTCAGHIYTAQITKIAASCSAVSGAGRQILRGSYLESSCQALGDLSCIHAAPLRLLLLRGLVSIAIASLSGQIWPVQGPDAGLAGQIGHMGGFPQLLLQPVRLASPVLEALQAQQAPSC